MPVCLRQSVRPDPWMVFSFFFFFFFFFFFISLMFEPVALENKFWSTLFLVFCYNSWCVSNFWWKTSYDTYLNCSWEGVGEVFRHYVIYYAHRLLRYNERDWVQQTQLKFCWREKCVSSMFPLFWRKYHEFLFLMVMGLQEVVFLLFCPNFMLWHGQRRKSKATN